MNKRTQDPKGSPTTKKQKKTRAVSSEDTDDAVEDLGWDMVSDDHFMPTFKVLEVDGPTSDVANSDDSDESDFGDKFDEDSNSDAFIPAEGVECDSNDVEEFGVNGMELMDEMDSESSNTSDDAANIDISEPENDDAQTASKSKSDEETVEQTKPEKAKPEKAKPEKKEAQKKIESTKEKRSELTVEERSAFLDKLKDWHASELECGYSVPEVLYRGIADMGLIYGPMPIQKAVLFEAINNRKDVIAAAQTGSGKTIAYLLPCLTNLLNNIQGRLKLKKDGKIEGEIRHRVEALIVVPSRELAHQVHTVAEKLTKHTKGRDYEVRTMAVMGGLSHQKQVRVMDKMKPHLVVGTPGRIWGLTFGTIVDKAHEERREAPSKYFSDLSDLRFLILDEADAMTDAKKGEYEHLEKILNKIRIKTKKRSNKLQRMVFSATLALPPHLKKQFPKLKLKSALRKKGEKEEMSATERLIEQVGLREDNLFVCDMSTTKAARPPTVVTDNDQATTTEPREDAMDTKGITKVNLALPSGLSIEKDTFSLKHDEERLYVHLLRHFQNDNGKKAIVFVRNKARVFRLTRMLKLLFGDERGDWNNPSLKPLIDGISQRAHVVGVMGGAKQADRLKKFEEFSKDLEDNIPRIMVCTDGVTARGIDFPDVDLVLHFQCPVNAAVFVHRSGRTARGLNKTGKAVCFDCDPKTAPLWRAIFKGVKLDFNSDAKEIEWSDKINKFNREHLRDIVKLAQELTVVIDTDRNEKKKYRQNATMAEQAELGYDDEIDPNLSDEEADEFESKVKMIPVMKAHLYSKLARKIFEPRPLWKQQLDMMNAREAEKKKSGQA